MFSVFISFLFLIVIRVYLYYRFAKSLNSVRQKSSPPTLTLPLSFDPEVLDGEGGGGRGGRG
jgi:hypothetical protein